MSFNAAVLCLRLSKAPPYAAMISRIMVNTITFTASGILILLLFFRVKIGTEINRNTKEPVKIVNHLLTNTRNLLVFIKMMFIKNGKILVVDVSTSCYK